MARKSTYNDPMAFERAIEELLTTESAVALGARLGVGQSTVSRYARGELLPDLARAADFAEVLGCTPHEVEVMIVAAKRARSKPQLYKRMTALEDEVTGLRDALAELRQVVAELGPQ